MGPLTTGATNLKISIVGHIRWTKKLWLRANKKTGTGQCIHLNKIQVNKSQKMCIGQPTDTPNGFAELAVRNGASQILLDSFG